VSVGEHQRRGERHSESELGHREGPEHQPPDAEPERHRDPGRTEPQRRLHERDRQHHPEPGERDCDLMAGAPGSALVFAALATAIALLRQRRDQTVRRES
jgi:hypothetical protein